MKKFILYWTEDDDTGKGVKCFTATEKERDRILQRYFEASLGPLEDIKYNKKAIAFPGITSKFIRCFQTKPSFHGRLSI